MTRTSIAGMLLAVVGFAALGVVAAVWFVQLGESRAREQAAVESMREFRKSLDKVNELAAETASELQVVEEKNDALGKRLRAALARTADCSLGADAGRVLRDVVLSAGAAAGPGDQARPDTVDPVVASRAGDQVEIDGEPVSCKAVAEWAQRNIAICQGDAVRFLGAIKAYEVVEGVR